MKARTPQVVTNGKSCTSPRCRFLSRVGKCNETRGQRPLQGEEGHSGPGYRVPEPALFLSTLSPERRKTFMTNWLAIRPLWISRLDHNPPAQFPVPQHWRDILHGVPLREELEAAGTSQNGSSAAKC